GKSESRTVMVPAGGTANVAFAYAPSAKPVAPTQTAPSAGAPGRAYRNEVWIPGGSFQMGSTDGDSDEEPVHTVTVSGFWMMKTEVTQGDYRALMGTNPSHFKGDSLPVEKVSWYDAVVYANALSKKDGLSPAYTINGTSVRLNPGASGWRLPTEAEWEYAAKGGPKASAIPMQAKWAGSSDVGSVAWYWDNSGKTTHPVGTKAANAAGLYDMAGNVWEWCQDLYGGYGSGSQTDPTGAASGTGRVNRGGSWSHIASYARSANRIIITPGTRDGALGFRLVRPPVR
ncbi:MAG: formylglycine-generating enzyme family protein, partial [Spirochaetales bacterium]|nr:formylglycine-generating enzyme family protein [Spirochaetales bacterium]